MDNDEHQIEITGFRRQAVICSCGFKVTDLSSPEAVDDVVSYHLDQPSLLGSDPW